MSSFKFTMKVSPQNSKRKGQYTKGFVEWEVANLDAVQSAVDKVGRAIYMRAQENLKDDQARDEVNDHPGESDLTHDTEIKFYKGDLDRFISLETPGGLAKARAVERGIYNRQKLPGRGRILERAASLPKWTKRF